jgi:FG-GAP repeat
MNMKQAIAILVCILGLSNSAAAAPYEVVPLSRPVVGAHDRFGAAVGVVGSLVIVGAPGADDGKGAVYLFDARTGELVREMRREDGIADDRFGEAVSGVGTRLLVGVPGRNRRIGAAYVYDLLTPSDPGSPLPRSGGTFGEEYGGALGSSLGHYLVAAPRFRLNPATDRAGIVYRFDRTSLGVTFSVTRPTPKQQVEFGFSVVGIGNTIAVGAPYDNQGTTGPRNGGGVYLYDAQSSEYRATIFQPTPSIGDKFGYAVGSVGNKLLVGSPRDGEERTGEVYVYDPTASATPLRVLQKPNADRGDEFGNAVAGVATNILVGARGDDDLAFNPSREDHFGWAVSSNGRNVVIGAPDDNEGAQDAGRAYLFIDLAPDPPGGGDPCNDSDVCTFDAGETPEACVHERIPGCCNVAADCSDGNQCDDLDACVSHQCVSQDPGCSDGIACTTDCSPTIGCIAPEAPPGFSGLICWLGALREALGTELPAIRQPFAARLSRLSVTSYTRAASASGEPAPRARRSLKQIKRRVQRIGRIIARAKQKNRLQAGLADRLSGLATNAQNTLPALRASLR